MQTIMARGRVYNYGYNIGRASASGGAGFAMILDIARDKGNLLYVLNRGYWYRNNNFVTILTMDEEFIREFGTRGEGDGEFVWPTSIATDNEGNVYVADEWLQRISIFDKDGNFLDKWGTPGAGKGELNGPTGLVFDREDNLYITEHYNHRVQKFTKDGKSLLTWGREGTGEGEFNRPWGINVDSEGDVFVADWRNQRVQKFSPDGQYLATFDISGTDASQMYLPSDVAVDKEGDVYVVDWWNKKVQVYDPEGGHLTTFIGDAEQLSKWGQEMIDINPDHAKARLRVKSLEPSWRFFRPTAITVDPDGKILVADCFRFRIQIYQKEASWVDPDYNL